MKHEDTRAALDLYDENAQAGGQPDSATRVGSLVLVHALLRPDSAAQLQKWDEHTQPHPVFLDSDQQERAACGLRMKVILPFVFDDEDADACEGCRSEVARWARNPELWWREQTRWEQRSRPRGEQTENVAVWRALQDRRRSAQERTREAK
jgi:hypothetical protein